MIYLIGIIIAFFLFFLILLKKDKKGPDYILLTWVCVLVIHLFLFYLQYTELSYQFPHVLGFILPIPVLHGMFLYFYTRALTGSVSLDAKSIAPHLLPFLLLLGLAWPFFSLSAQEKIEVFQQEGKGFEWYSVINFMMILVSGFAYSMATVLELRKYRKRILYNFSNNEKKMLRWLEYLTIGLGMIWLLSAFFEDNIIFTGVVFFVLFIGFFGINQVPAFYSYPHSPISSDDHDQMEKVNEKEKYAKTGLKSEEVPMIMERLEELMRKEQLFKNGELTLNDLALKLGVPLYQLSQVINSISGKTFHHYINSYRIEAFLETVSKPENKKYTYLALAYECGFNSKTTFNKYFKLQTGKTPSEYLGTNL